MVPKMPAGFATPRVLVVDDDRSLADALCVVLNQHGFNTSAAYSGPEAIHTALKSPPNFILMDIMMNGIDGGDAAIAICETLPRCRILLMSGAEDAIQRLDKASSRGHRFELMTKRFWRLLCCRSSGIRSARKIGSQSPFGAAVSRYRDGIEVHASVAERLSDLWHKNNAVPPQRQSGNLVAHLLSLAAPKRWCQPDK